MDGCHEAESKWTNLAFGLHAVSLHPNRRGDERALRRQDAHRSTDAVPVAAGGGHRNPVLRPSGLDYPDRLGPQRTVFLVVGRPGVSPGLGALPRQRGQGEPFR